MRTYTLRQEIEFECAKQIRRHGLSVALARRQQRIFYRRTWIRARKPVSYAPQTWSISSSFNPFYVRKRTNQFSKAISQRIEEGTFEPKPALHLDIPKPDGSHRTISVSSVADAAVSKWLYRRLIAKNLHRFSSYAFAYRPDRKIVHAVEHLSTYIAKHPRVFVVEYDFRKYFDTIDHDYLIGLLSERVQIGKRELNVVRSFLSSRFAKAAQYQTGHFNRRKQGIAQGSCLSLFLANLACIELDDAIEKTGACFARFADDTVILCKSYVQATECASILHTFKEKAGTELNLEKSDGISLLTKEPDPEMRGKTGFTFLGHFVSVNGVSLAEKTERKIKNKLSTIIHRHLLLYPSTYDQMSPNRIDLENRIDWDLVTCINELRSYIYGNLSEAQVNELSPIPNSIKLNGVVAFLSSVTIGDRFRALDGWMVNALRRGLSERRRRLWRWFGFQTPLLTRTELIDGSWYTHETIENETRLPSFFSAWRATRRVAISQGAGSLPSPGYNYD